MAKTHSLSRSSLALRPSQIVQIARQAGIRADELYPIGLYKAKLDPALLDRLKARPNGKLICVTSINPTAAGEGKTCIAIGLTQALGRLKKKVVAALREPSLAPILGSKGGGTGAGMAQLLPHDDINLLFNGDFHAVEMAANLLAAAAANHIHHGNALGFDPQKGLAPRAIDIGDRFLRHATGTPSTKKRALRLPVDFQVTAATEMMAILALASSFGDLQKRLSRVIAGWTAGDEPITAQDLKLTHTLSALLRLAFWPNLVQTMEGQPCLVHTGPFANVSTGNSSFISLLMASKLGDYVVTESGFGTDLGMQKLFDLLAPSSTLRPAVAVLVITVKALKHHSKDEKWADGFRLVDRHIENIRAYGITPILALNRFPQDTAAEITAVTRFANDRGLPFAVSTAVADGGAGSEKLASLVVEAAQDKGKSFKRFVPDSAPLDQKLRLIAQKIYGAEDITLSPEAQTSLERLKKNGFDHLAVNIAKSPYSLTGDPKQTGVLTKPWNLKIRDFMLYAGAGYAVALTGEVLLMPGMPKEPLYERWHCGPQGEVRWEE